MSLPELPPDPLAPPPGPAPKAAADLPDVAADPAWLAAARRHLGLRELPGPGSNPEIVEWAKAEGGWVAEYYKGDDIPWCALFVCHCLREAGVQDPATLAAADFAAWGQPLARGAVAPGAVLVFKRPGGGHVGFYVGERPDAYRVLGGNQSDAVTETWVARERLYAVRWPGEVAAPVPRPVLLAADGAPLSTNEG